MPNAAVLLALDTATSVCSVALAVRGVLDERRRDVGHGHTEHVLPMVDEVLATHGVELTDCDAIAFGAGPGSFTGLRIACGVAQGLACGADRRVLAIGSLEALACDAFGRSPGAQRILVAQDARMGEAYWAVYQRGPDGPQEIARPAIAAPAQLAQLAARFGADALAGDALAAFRGDLAGFPGERIAAASASARSVAVLALAAFARGEAADPAAAAPLYVRDHVAFTIDERRALAAARA